MKALKTLLKLAKRDLEALRGALAAEQAKMADVRQRVLGHEQSVRAEQQLALRDYESARAFTGFAVAARMRLNALEGEREMADQNIARLRDLITAAHVEMRKFERLIELQDARERQARERRENAELDEMATLRAGKMGG